MIRDWSSQDQWQVGNAMSALLSPLAHETRADWFRAISRELRPLFRGDSTLIAYASEKSSGHFSADAPELAEAIESNTMSRRGELHFSDEVMEAGMIARRQRSMTVFTSTLLDELSGGQLAKSPLYNDVCCRFEARVTYAIGIRGDDGEALLGVNAARPRRDPLSSETFSMLSFLAAPFQAGFEILERLDEATRALTSTLDMLTEGIAIYDAERARELHRNPALLALLAADEQGHVLADRVRTLAQSLCTLGRCVEVGSKRQLPLHSMPAFDDVHTNSAHYTLRASFLPASVYARERVVLVAVERRGITLPSSKYLRDRFGLTPREAQVALRLAEGDSDADLAHALGVSPHTVRHHTERIFDKLQLRSRKALALWLASHAIE
jgi:DNA-binding CsgD family transcriptional regulator